MVNEIWGRAWREFRRVLVSVGLGLAAFFLLFATVAALLFSLAWIGLPVFVEVIGLVRRLAGVQRRRSSPPIPVPYAPLPDGLLRKVRALLTEPATWRDLGWLVVQGPVGLIGMIAFGLWPAAVQGVLMPLVHWLLPPSVDDLSYQGIPIDDQRTAWLVIPLGILIGLVAYALPRWYLAGEAWLARWLLAPTAAQLADQLAARVERLAETRAAVVDASAAELRRIERDLHDGAQARLVALTMNLGMAEDLFETDPDTARAMLADARAGARDAMGELRDLVRGIHPPMLADRGLPGAMQALAMASSIPIDLDLRLERRLPAPVESAAYFALSEAVANAIKHSHAERITLSATDRGSAVVLRVSDDGRGGADPGRGTGLRGMERRLAAFDGTVRVSSPVGGPTVIEMELPCAS
ncbi:sensor histidine kinase [Micromonospora sp. CPCC 206061]|uniref:sensor histidine kinase n=1 Tax=Micromonospora sp. CPCC 206061 TaxID=3122410 RepID=UPI002FF34CDC